MRRGGGLAIEPLREAGHEVAAGCRAVGLGGHLQIGWVDADCEISDRCEEAWPWDTRLVDLVPSEHHDRPVGVEAQPVQGSDVDLVAPAWERLGGSRCGGVASCFEHRWNFYQTGFATAA